MADSDNEIAIVGMSCVFPKAIGVRQYWSNLVNAIDAVDHPPGLRWSTHSNFKVGKESQAYLPGNKAGFFPAEFFYDPAVHLVQPNLVKHGDPDQFLMLHLIDRALHDAQVGADDPVRKRTDVILGRGGYPTNKHTELILRSEIIDSVLELLERKEPDFFSSRKRDLELYLRGTLTKPEEDNVSTFIPNICASRAANRLNLRGAAYTIDGACASSLLAVEESILRLRAGSCDIAIAGGLHMNLAPSFLYVFNSLGALSPSQTVRPFDKRADGLVAGEGGGVIVLKRLADALQAGDRIYAVVKGVGSSSDGREVDVMAPAVAGQVMALERAYKEAGVDPDTVGLLEAHGTATLVGDLVEIESIKRFFGKVPEPSFSRAMGSVKSMIGHCMPASGIAAIIKMALSLSNKIMPPSLHCEEPREELLDSPFYVNTKTRPWIHDPKHGPRRAGVNAFGFGGINAHVVLEEVTAATGRKSRSNGVALEAKPRPIEPCMKRETELFVFAADDRADLASQIQRVLSFMQGDESGAKASDIAAHLSRNQGQGRVTLAIIAADLGTFKKHAEPFLDAKHEPTHADVHFSPNAVPAGKVAAIFPGMGFPGLIGNYPDHLMELCLNYPDVRAEFDLFEHRDNNPLDPIPTSAIFNPPAHLPVETREKFQERLAPPKADEYTGLPVPPRERYLAAMAVTLANWAGWVLLRKFNISVDMMTGQSQGEMAALCAAGDSDFHVLAPNFWDALDIDPRDPAKSCLAFAWTSAEKVDAILPEFPTVHAAIYMSPQSVIFGGPRADLLRVAEKLRADDETLVTLLPFPAIHTPRLSHLREEVKKRMDPRKIRVLPPKVPLYSSITTKLYPADEEGIRETLFLNIDHPLRIWETLRKMYADGARIFIQVGGGHMASHMGALLEEGSEITTAALDLDPVNPITQLNHLCAILFCEGVPISFEPLYEGRPTKTIDLDKPGKSTRGRLAMPLMTSWTSLLHPSVPPKRESTPHAPREDRDVIAAETNIVSAVPASDPLAEREEYTAFGLPSELIRRLPLFGRVVEFTPETEVVIERTLDLNEDVYLLDHSFAHVKHKAPSEWFAVVPLTMSLELSAEIAGLLCPGQGFLGFENCRGKRWVALTRKSRGSIRLEAKRVAGEFPDGRLRVKVGIHTEGALAFEITVLYGHEMRPSLDFVITDPPAGQPWPYAVEDVYRERLMFHGPAFRCISNFGDYGNPTCTAELQVLPRHERWVSNPDPILLVDPFTLDGIGQVFGLWTRSQGQYIMPIGFQMMEFYTGPPAVGDRILVRMHATEVDLEVRQIKCNMECVHPDGTVWLRVSGWTDWIMGWTERYEASYRLPGRYLLAEELPLPNLPPGAACTYLRYDEFRSTDLGLAALTFLHEEECSLIEVDMKRARALPILASRMAAKDAARIWRSRSTDLPAREPSEYLLRHDERGKPYFAEPADGPLPAISLSHTDKAAVALAANEAVGIDIEPADRITPELLTEIAASEEISLVESLEAQYPGEHWATRLWCAKEAASKAAGTGLEGRPKQFRATDAEPTGVFLIQNIHTGDRWIVGTHRVETFVVAVASASMGGK